MDAEIDIPRGKAGHNIRPCRGELHVFIVTDISINTLNIVYYIIPRKQCTYREDDIPSHLRS